MRFVKNEFLYRPNFLIVDPSDNVTVGLRFQDTARMNCRSFGAFGFWRVKWKDHLHP